MSKLYDPMEISEEERRRRVAEVYALLLEYAASHRARKAVARQAAIAGPSSGGETNDG